MLWFQSKANGRYSYSLMIHTWDSGYPRRLTFWRNLNRHMIGGPAETHFDRDGNIERTYYFEDGILEKCVEDGRIIK